MAVIGGGLTGSHLAVALRLLGHPVTLLSPRTPGLVRAGAARSAYILFGRGRAHHRVLGLEPTAMVAPDIASVSVRVSPRDGEPSTRRSGALRTPARAMDPRVLQAYAVDFAVGLGAELRVQTADSATLDELHGSHDLVVVASGPDADDDRGSHEPAAAGRVHRLAIGAYVSGVVPSPDSPADELTCAIVPGAGELCIVPAATAEGTCHLVLLHAVPEGPFDLDGEEPGRDVLPLIREAIQANLPQELRRLAEARPLDDGLGHAGGWTGRVHRPVVRRPVIRPSSGRSVLAVRSEVGTRLFGLEANHAVLAATTCAELIHEHEGVFDESWVRRTAKLVEREVRHAAAWQDVLRSDVPGPVREFIADALKSPVETLGSAPDGQDPMQR